jgi:hypothetical protein
MKNEIIRELSGRSLMLSFLFYFVQLTFNFKALQILYKNYQKLTLFETPLFLNKNSQ